MSATNWTLDPAHSEITFKVRHMMISNVKGEFKNFTVDVTNAGDDLTNANAKVTIDASSINTNNTDRDNHLRSADFFNAETNPQITFVSSSLTPKGDDFELKGDLTINGITKPVTLDVEYGGVNTDPWGNKKAGFTVEGKINRKDFGVNWNTVLETGGVMVSDEVKVYAEIQLVQSAA